MAYLDALKRAGACQEAIDWVQRSKHANMQESLEKMDNSAWYVWVLRKSGYAESQITTTLGKIKDAAMALLPDALLEKDILRSALASPDKQFLRIGYESARNSFLRANENTNEGRLVILLARVAHIVCISPEDSSGLLGATAMNILRADFPPTSVIGNWITKFGS